MCLYWKFTFSELEQSKNQEVRKSILHYKTTQNQAFECLVSHKFYCFTIVFNYQYYLTKRGKNSHNYLPEEVPAAFAFFLKYLFSKELC